MENLLGRELLRGSKGCAFVGEGLMGTMGFVLVVEEARRVCREVGRKRILGRGFLGGGCCIGGIVVGGGWVV